MANITITKEVRLRYTGGLKAEHKSEMTLGKDYPVIGAMEKDGYLRWIVVSDAGSASFIGMDMCTISCRETLPMQPADSTEILESINEGIASLKNKIVNGVVRVSDERTIKVADKPNPNKKAIRRA